VSNIELKVGQRVKALQKYGSKSLSGRLGTAIYVASDAYPEALVEFDDHIGGHDGNIRPIGKDGHCWYMPATNEYLEIIHEGANLKPLEWFNKVFTSWEEE